VAGLVSTYRSCFCCGGGAQVLTGAGSEVDDLRVQHTDPALVLSCGKVRHTHKLPSSSCQQAGRQVDLSGRFGWQAGRSDRCTHWKAFIVFAQWQAAGFEPQTGQVQLRAVHAGHPWRALAIPCPLLSTHPFACSWLDFISHVRLVLQDRAVRLWHLTSGTCILVTSMSPHAVLTVVSGGRWRVAAPRRWLGSKVQAVRQQGVSVMSCHTQLRTFPL
jgi:hypothetical protein